MASSNNRQLIEISELEGKPTSLSAQKIAQADAVRRAASVLLNDPNLRKDNLGELLARTYAQEALQGIMQIARDATVDPSIRHKAYLDVFHIAYGRPAAVIRSQGESNAHITIDHDIAAAGEAAENLNLLAEYASVPPEEWPEELRKAAGLTIEAGD